MQRTAAVRAVARGLAVVEPTTSNTLIAFAARAGSTAADGDGPNSPFTAALLEHITQPGLDIQMALRRVRDEVRRNTGNRQDPFVYGSLGGDEIALVPHPSAAKQPVVIEPGVAAQRDYALAERIGTAEAWNTFLAAHGTGFHADLARAQLAKLANDARRAASERDAARELQTAALTPRTEPAAPPLAGGALVLEIKKELKRVGCYAGRIDDRWETSETRASVGRFAKHASLSTSPGEPSADFLDLVRRTVARICPVVCGRGHHVEGNECVKTICKAGYVLSDSGACQKSSERARRPLVRAASAPAVIPSSRGGRATSGGYVTCGRNGCQTVPAGCYAVRRAGGGGLGGRIFCQ